MSSEIIKHCTGSCKECPVNMVCAVIRQQELAELYIDN